MQDRIRSFAVLILLAVCFVGQAIAQSTPWVPGFRVMGAQQGLSNSAIDAIVRDHQGVVWMATEDGLVRHVGRDFSILRHADTEWLPGNSIQALHVDAKDALWISVLGHGVVRLDADRSHTQRFDARLHPALVDVWAIQDDGDTVWFGTANHGLLRWDSRSRTIALPGSPDVFTTDARKKIVTMASRGPDDLWVATAGGLLHVSQGNVEAVPMPLGASDDVVYSLAIDGGRIWVGTSAGVFSMARNGRPEVPAWSSDFSKPAAAIRIVPDARGALWIATQRGVRRVEGGRWRDVMIEGALSGRSVRGMFRQPDGALWLSAPGVGVAYLRPDWKNITQLRALPDVASGLSSNDYRALASSHSEGWWVAGMGGVLEHVTADGHVSMRVKGIDKTARPRAVLESDADHVWLAARDALYRIQSGRVIKVFDSASHRDAIPDVALGELRAAGRGRFWLSAPGWGVQLRDGQGRVLNTVRNAADAPIGVQSIDALFNTPLFAVIDGQLFELAPEANAFNALAIAGDTAFDRVAVVSENRIWAHAPEGLFAFERRGGRWVLQQKIAADRQWVDLDAKGLRVDATGRLWLATSRGMFLFERTGKPSFDVRNGLSNQQLVVDSLAVASRDSRAAAAAENGAVMIFSPKGEEAGIEWPRLAPIGVFARSEGRWQRVAPSDHRFHIPKGGSEIRLQFNAVAYDDPEAVRYQVRIQGLDRDWIDLGAANERILTGIAPGTYAVSARVSDRRGRVSGARQFALTVPPRWWETVAFKIGLFVLITLLVAIVIRSRILRMQRMRELAHTREKATLHANASAAKSTFLATLGHEIRTPMTGVLGMSELLSATALSPLQMQRVNSIRKSSEHLLRIVDDALDLARIEAGKMAFVDAPFAVVDLLEEIAEWATPVSGKKHLRFEFHHTVGCDLRVSGDVVRVRQVLMNLVGNAIKFTASGVVNLSHAIEANGIHVFRVRDTGPGMDAEQCKRVFERFEQADGALTAHRHGGSGLGLAISSELVIGMGGRLTVSSVPGSGSTFSVHIPLRTVDIPVASALPVHPGSTQAGHRILLVEDDETVAEVLSGMLTQAGHHVAHAVHGLAALVELSARRFDLAILDLDLPAIDGFDLARQLRVSGFAGPILAVSARTDADAETSSRDAGFNRFLRKPIRTADLLAAIDEEMRHQVAQAGSGYAASVRVAP
ncbi:hybrid sensor histidine kinase/response regulator [Lysobacter soyae]|uniref:histidine kinase n=1 Tax=Lysobacter soyae TaxID=2764185 RepID=A0ABX8WRK2_9GAMM|nr:hybrid sensor histidine kinase/response regulator [Lysobacter sp. CJ11]QYR53453.1 response regulator [Lysobacter sp. CJ11]